MFSVRLEKRVVVWRSIFALMLLSIGATACQEADELSDTTQKSLPVQDANPVSIDVSGEVLKGQYADWAGKWTGPEGLFVEIEPQSTGSYRLTMQSDLDTNGTYEGKPVKEG